MRSLALVILALVAGLIAPARAQEVMDDSGLTRYDGVEFVPTEWGDGDSFRVRLPDSEELTVRLYGADAIEWHVADDTDARRLRAQRRYFGISGPDPATSIERAKGLGEQAAVEVRKLLQKPFTLFTAHADARGDGRHKRVYGFVRTAEGKDLATELVRQGLARAFGVTRRTPEGQSHDEYRETLRDLELRAARLGLGIWNHTDWETLADERRLERLEEEESRLATGRGPLPEGFQLDANTAARDELMRLPGVGEVMANRIIENRPYTRPEELQKVPGIGEATLERLRPYLKLEK